MHATFVPFVHGSTKKLVIATLSLTLNWLLPGSTTFPAWFAAPKCLPGKDGIDAVQR
jgi:hypothetical protein